MANNRVTKKEVEKLIAIPGKVRGQVFLTDFGYVEEEKGEKGVELLKKKMAGWGNPIDYTKVKALEWYPVGLRAVSLLAVKESFNWGEKEIFDLGNNAPKYSLIVKMLMKYFLSVPKTFEQVSHYWEKHYSVGELEAVKYSEEKGYFLVHLKNFKIHPILCTLYAGYFLRIGQYVVREEMTIQETKCMFKGDPYHEYLIRWK